MNDLAALRAFLPEILESPQALDQAALEDERVIDLEWHRAKKNDDDEDPCGCGRDLPDGALELIGVGNDRLVVQLDWLALPVHTRHWVAKRIERLVTDGVTIYHNADADIRKMREFGFVIWPAMHARLEDTMLADAVLHSEEAHRLGDVNRRYGRLPDFKHLKKSNPREYNAGDLVATYWIKKDQDRQFAADPQAHHVYRTMSIPFIDIGIEGEEAGVRVDPKVAVDLYHKYGARVESARRLAWGYTGNPLMNLSSPDAMKQWTHKVYGLPEQMPKHAKWDPEAGPTLGKDALATLRRMVGTEWDPDEEPTLEAAVDAVEAGGNGLLEAKYLYAGANQRLTHYVMPCIELVNATPVPRARVYPELRQHTQATGRHSYVGPALQQMKGETAGLVCPDPGTVWIGWDWSQIEIRLLAYLADDQVYLDAYARGEDVHEVNRAAIFAGGGYAADVIETQRGFAKRFGFRLHYRGLAKNATDIPGVSALGLDGNTLVKASDAYLALHPAIPAYWAKLDHEGAATGMVRTFMGRPRRLTSQWPNARKREGSNHPMQGGVSDIYVTTALLIKAAAPWARLVFGAHDAQTWQVAAEREAEFVGIAAPITNRVFRINGHDATFPATFKRRAA